MPLIVLIGYAVGSVPFALLLAKRWGTGDLRLVGSGNVGAANVMRASGLTPGLLAAMLDMSKGMASVLIAERLAGPGLGPAVGGLAAVVGHIYPVWIGFRGGKGVATGLGVLLALHPEVAGYGLAAFAVAFLASRVVSVSSLSAAVMVVIALFWRGPVDASLVPMLMCLVVIVARHTDNIRRLRRRQELSL